MERDSGRKPHQAVLWRYLAGELIQTFGGVTGPEIYRKVGSIPGQWQDDAKEIVGDECRKYTVDVPEDKRIKWMSFDHCFAELVIHLTNR